MAPTYPKYLYQLSDAIEMNLNIKPTFSGSNNLMELVQKLSGKTIIKNLILGIHTSIIRTSASRWDNKQLERLKSHLRGWASLWDNNNTVRPTQKWTT